MNNKKTLCKKCGRRYHPAEFEVCWQCWACTPSKVLKHFQKKYKEPEPFASWKDYEESTLK